MPVILWLVFWLIFGAPDVYMWNVWAVSLTICILWWLLG